MGKPFSGSGRDIAAAREAVRSAGPSEAHRDCSPDAWTEWGTDGIRRCTTCGLEQADPFAMSPAEYAAAAARFERPHGRPFAMGTPIKSGPRTASIPITLNPAAIAATFDVPRSLLFGPEREERALAVLRSAAS